MLRSFSLAGVLALIGSACSDGDDGGMSRAEFCERWAAAACSDRVVSACQAASAEACRATQSSFCLTLVPEDFSDRRADACLDAVARAYRDADLTAAELPIVLRLAAPCDEVVQGPRRGGESCTSTRDCDAPGGYVCVTKGGSPSGTCERPVIVGPGRSCAAPRQLCEPGFYCDGSHCIEAEAVGSPCESHPQCGEGGHCGAEGACLARLPVNSPCTEDDQCLSGLCYTFGIGDRTCTDHLVLSRSEPVCANLR